MRKTYIKKLLLRRALPFSLRTQLRTHRQRASVSDEEVEAAAAAALASDFISKVLAYPVTEPACECVGQGVLRT